MRRRQQRAHHDRPARPRPRHGPLDRHRGRRPHPGRPDRRPPGPRHLPGLPRRAGGGHDSPLPPHHPAGPRRPHPARRTAGPARSLVRHAHPGRRHPYFVQDSGAVRAVAPATGHTLWDTASSVERPGAPVVSDAYVLLASPGGRLAALDRTNGKEVHSVPGRGTGLEPFTGYAGAPPVVHGDAVYVPYGTRSVYTVNLRAL
ncbi:PQQ-binding-like beta-propeller repeat protein [Streptomyces diastatochromogenes]|nr:PQQ-binding-like beta-propeller repeat protein [Streptomyces diastatochromogenes]